MENNLINMFRLSSHSLSTFYSPILSENHHSFTWLMTLLLLTPEQKMKLNFWMKEVAMKLAGGGHSWYFIFLTLLIMDHAPRVWLYFTSIRQTLLSFCCHSETENLLTFRSFTEDSSSAQISQELFFFFEGIHANF